MKSSNLKVKMLTFHSKHVYYILNRNVMISEKKLSNRDKYMYAIKTRYCTNIKAVFLMQ